MLPQRETRKEVLIIFFKIYLDIYGKYGDIVATSDDLCGLAYIYYSDRPVKKMTYLSDCCKGVIKSFDFLRYISFKRVIYMLKTLNIMSSEWIKTFTQTEEYIHLDLIVVHPGHRGEGKSKQILNYVIAEANREHKLLTLETQNPDNVALYTHFGFETVETIEGNDTMRQYCMIKQPEAQEE